MCSLPIIRHEHDAIDASTQLAESTTHLIEFIQSKLQWQRMGSGPINAIRWKQGLGFWHVESLKKLTLVFMQFKT